MIFQNNRGVLLEQNKEPMLSKEIIRIEQCNQAEKRVLRLNQKPELLSPYEILMAAKEARIIDETDGKKLWKKLASSVREGMGNIVIDAIDDEPYISSQLSPTIAYSDNLAQGISLIKRAVGATEVVIETYKNLTDIELKIPSKIGDYRVDKVSGRYPIEQRALSLSHKKNATVIGACAALALRDAIYEGKVHTTCFVTVGGSCVSNPANYQVPIGISVKEMLDIAGTLAPPKKIIAGGSMTGFVVHEPEHAIVTPTTRGILAFLEEHSEMQYTCIGCGRCTKACHMGLSPYYIYKVMNSKGKKNLDLFDAYRCTGCGICSYVCPAKLDLQQTVQKAAKFSLSKGEQE